jgi:mycothiol synthase
MSQAKSVRSRPVTGERDLAAMYDLAAVDPNNTLHLADLPWRFRSPAYQQPERTQLWENESGELLGWAVLSSGWSCVDDVIRPGPVAEEVANAVLDWAVERLQREASATEQQLTFFVASRADDMARIASIERHGFTQGNWGYLHLARDLTPQIPEPVLPAGFTIRPLAGEREVDAYVALHRTAFESTRMNSDWRSRTLQDPHYDPNLDLVAVAPNGLPVGFCVCWITPELPALGGRRRAQVEPMGVLPEYRRLGLGRALLNEGARRARALGADRIDVDSVDLNAAAIRSYETVGFRWVYDEPFYVREFS